MNHFDNGFIRTTEKSLDSLTSEQKARLNRKGNELFNKGEILAAERIFVTTGYYDGLTRLGDYYFKENKKLRALKFYHLAKNKNKEALVLDELANIIKLFL